jgi:hypothetical protein
MGAIYSAAGIVIVAAAGEGPSYGLPGVSVRARRPQRFVKSREYALVETLPDTVSDIRGSVWASRAWTYQEGHLARRRLVFTDQEVAFVCGYGFCVESLCTTIETAEYFNGDDMDELFSRDHGEYDNQKYDAFLRGYTRRELSFGSDAVNASLGVLNSWCRSSSDKESFVHLWGLKFTADWLDLTWYAPRPGERRPGFPTWSWAASNCVVLHRYSEGFRTRHSETGQLELGIPQNFEKLTRYQSAATLTWQPLEIYHQSLKGTSPDQRRSPRLLKMTAICGRVQVSRSVAAYLDCVIQVGPTATRSEVVVHLDLDLKLVEADLQECLAMYIQGKETYNLANTLSASADMTKAAFLILRPVPGQEVFERIGVSLPYEDMDSFERTWSEQPEVFRTVVIV